MVSYYIYIEGAKNIDNGDLKKSFHMFFEKAGVKRQPRIIMGNGISQTVDKFKNHDQQLDRKSHGKILLIDSDCLEDDKDAPLSLHQIKEEHSEGIVFFMVQAMEAWFISQKEVLSKLYGTKVIKSLPGRPAHEIVKPKKELIAAFEKVGEKYHEIKDGTKILQNLDPSKLVTDFKDVKELISKLN